MVRTSEAEPDVADPVAMGIDMIGRRHFRCPDRFAILSSIRRAMGPASSDRIEPCFRA